MLLTISIDGTIFIIGMLLLGFIFLIVYLAKELFLCKKRYDYNYYRKLKIQEILPLKIQAYERLTLFVERINPSNMFLRIGSHELSVSDMQRILLNEVRKEFEYNFSQQLYVSEEAWKIISKTKDETVFFVNTIASTLPENSPAIELSKKALEQFAKMEGNAYVEAVCMLRNELNKYLS